MDERERKCKHATNEMAGSITRSPTVIKAQERNALQLKSTAGGSSPPVQGISHTSPLEMFAKLTLADRNGETGIETQGEIHSEKTQCQN